MPLITVSKCVNCEVAHEWLFEGATLRELRVIKQVTGMSQKAFAAAGDEGDPDALAALLYILHIRDKIKIPFEDIDLDFNTFEMKATKEEEEAIAEFEAKAAAEASESPKE